jgi:esterase/lipase superfamily enzyme
LLELLRLIKEEAGVDKLYVIAHSMGNQILLDALARAQDANDKLTLTELIMASPDVDKDVFIERLDHLKLISGGLTLYASSADKAMMISRLKAGSPRAGDVTLDGPVIVPRTLDTIDISALGNDPFALNHGVALSSRSLIDDIGRLLRTGTRPPGDRSPQLIPVWAVPPTVPPTARYWKYPQ